ncbi:MAG: hypothetical protein ACLQFI_06765 [Methylocella sp.]
MSSALGILLALLSLCLAIITVDGPILVFLIPFLVAAGLVLVSVKLCAREAQHMSEVVSRPYVIGAGIPAVLMIIQILPLPFLANPVWTSLSPGLRNEITGSISVDVVGTAIALVNYLTAAGVLLLTAAVAINRNRAESVFIGTTVVAVLIAFACLSQDLFLQDFFGINILAHRESAFEIVCLGVTLSAACGLLVFERYETRGAHNIKAKRKFFLSSVACMTSFVLCASATAVTKSGSLILAAGAGLVAFVAVAAIGRWALGRLGAAAIGITAAVIGTALLTVAANAPDPRFTFIKKDAAVIELSQRILKDVPFFGYGAGSIKALLPIYQPGNVGSPVVQAVTAAAKLSIEMGKGMLWFAVLAASLAVFQLLQGAAGRDRDSFYAAAAGACLITLMILAFAQSTLSGSAVVLLSATIFGLGLTQSKSKDREQEKRLLDGLRSFEGVETLTVDRVVEWPASGTEQEKEKEAEGNARGLLKQTGADF